jgi:hypothetical protein
MPTPNSYDSRNFGRIINAAPNLFHQTSIRNLPAIIRAQKILSPGTLWGLNPALANNHYQGNQMRLNNLKIRAERGFIDYVFCSFFNGIQSGFQRYGYVSIEIDRRILLKKEAFIYPFNFVTMWGTARAADKYSDLTTWNTAVQLQNRINITEVLVRRQIKLDPNWVRFHCFRSHGPLVLDLLRESGYDYPVEQYDNPPAQARFQMNELERMVLIRDTQYRGLLSTDGRHVSIFNVVADDDMDFLGRFEVDDNDNLIEHFPMTGRREIVGRLLQQNQARNAQ